MSTITDLTKAQSSGAVPVSNGSSPSAEGSFQTLLASDAAAAQAGGVSAQETAGKATAQTFYATQIIGQDESAEDETASDAVAAFRRFAKAAQDGPAALMRAQYLESKNLTEEDVAAMPLEDRKKLEEEIAEYIKQKLEEETGIAAQDVSGPTIA